MPHLKTGNSEAAGVVHGGAHRHQVGAVGDVLLVEPDGPPLVTCPVDSETAGTCARDTDAERVQLRDPSAGGLPISHLGGIPSS